MAVIKRQWFQFQEKTDIHKELAKSGVTLSLLWNEYCLSCRANQEIPYSYRLAWGGAGHSNKAYVREVINLVEHDKRFCIEVSTQKAAFPKHPLFLKMTDSPIPYAV